MPSVRSLARRVRIHHNTVSQAYQDLVQRKWLTRRKGSRLIVGGRADSGEGLPAGLDELINETIQRAKELGFPLQTLTKRVRERLLAEPPDHVLVVEEEAGLCKIIREELQASLRLPVESCSPQELSRDPALLVGAQVFAPVFVLRDLGRLVPANRPGVPIVYSGADKHLELVRNLKKPSVIASVSISQSMLRTARGLFAPAVGRKHTFQMILFSPDRRIDLRGADIVFCDSVTFGSISSPRKIHYRLIDRACLEQLTISVKPFVS